MSYLGRGGLKKAMAGASPESGGGNHCILYIGPHEKEKCCVGGFGEYRLKGDLGEEESKTLGMLLDADMLLFGKEVRRLNLEESE